MVMTPPHIQSKRQKMALELAWLKIKEKIFGKLSERDSKRLREIRLELTKCY